MVLQSLGYSQFLPITDYICMYCSLYLQFPCTSHFPLLQHAALYSVDLGYAVSFLGKPVTLRDSVLLAHLLFIIYTTL